MDGYEKQLEAVEKQKKEQYDKNYQRYIGQLKMYMIRVHSSHKEQLLRLNRIRSFNHSTTVLPKIENADQSSNFPASPFGGIRHKSQLEDKTVSRASAVPTGIMKVEPRPENIDVHRKALHLESLCNRFLPTVRKHCFDVDKTDKKYASRCKGYFHDCQTFLPKSDPLYNIAYAFTKSMSSKYLEWSVKGIPYYIINKDREIGSGRRVIFSYGNWGAGVADNIGVRDYWSQTREIGANWYEGRYGVKTGWSMPLVQSLGIEGGDHTLVSVPIKKGELGKPVRVDVGRGVGPYYQENRRINVDYLNGNINLNHGVAVPMAGVGVNNGLGITFPNYKDIFGK